MIVDTLHYGFRPRGEAFHALPLTDTTVYPRDAGIQGATPVAIRAVLEGQNGEQVVSNAASYVPGNGMETAYNRRHLLDQSGEEVCWIWEELPAGVTYAKLRLRSTRPIIVHELRWDFVSRA